MKKWKKWKKGIAVILAGATFLSSVPAFAEDLFVDGAEAAVAVPVMMEEPQIIEESPVVEEEPLVVEESVVEEPPVVEEPVVEESPAVEEPVVEEPPAVEEPVVEEPPAVEEPVVEEPPVQDDTSMDAGDMFTDGTVDAPEGDVPAEEGEGEIPTDDIPAIPEKTYPIYTSPTLAELGNFAQNEAGAATEVPETVIPAESQVYNWFFQSFYVQEENTNYVTENQEFLLKYQMEFYSDWDFDNPFDVVIRIPKILLWQQNGEESIPVVPTVIGVPRCEIAEDGSRIDIASPVTPFNYYEETGADGVDYLVFYNYQAVQAGMGSAFQVVYGPVDVTTVADGTAWSLAPTLQILGGEAASYPALEGIIELPEPTPEATATPEPTPEVTATPEPTPEATATPEPTPEVTATPEPTPEPTPEATATPEPTPEATPTPLLEYPTYDSMSIADLANLGEETVGAATETPGNMAITLFADEVGEKVPAWFFETYYVGQEDPHHVYKEQDFSLKYQMEFRADSDMEKGDVLIRIPRRLLQERDRDGSTDIFPSDIAVPQGGLNEDGSYIEVESRVTPFNYYVEGDELVFYNYKCIQAGTNAAWQVLYRGVDVSRIVDGTAWTLTPKITIKKRTDPPQDETTETTPLTGEVRTTATLNNVEKDILNISGKNYGPGLYTKRQVENILGKALPEPYATNFDDYVYAGWKVFVDVDVVQPVSLKFTDNTTYKKDGQSIAGEVVGISTRESIEYYTEEQADNDRKYRTGIQNIKIVTAYPKGEVTKETPVKNTFTVEMELWDSKSVQTKADDASWVYKDYDFTYEGDDYGAWKEGEASYPGWLNVFNTLESEDEAAAYLDAFPFTTDTFMRGYEKTHQADSALPEFGERKKGTFYKVETIDGFFAYGGTPIENPDTGHKITDGHSLHAYSNTGDGAEAALGAEDFYIKNLSVCRVDRSYDVWEDEYVNTPEFDEAGENAVDQTMFVMAAYEAPTDGAEPTWREVAAIPWEDGNHSNGQRIYIDNENLKQDGKYPIAVKVFYKGISYDSKCSLSFDVQLRHDSPQIKALLETDPNQEKGISVVNTARNDFSFFDGADTKILNSLYRSSQVTVSHVGKEAASYKTAKVSNDSINGQVLVDYNLTAQSGYTVYSRDTINYLLGKGGAELLFPDLNEESGKSWIFYDLLPYGMTPDFTKPVIAGRIMRLDDHYQNYPESWDTTDVSVSIDPETDVIDNWKETGRTMVKFHLRYTGEDPTVYTRNLWMEGWGISFRARYDWTDLNLLEKDANISAFTPEDSSLSLVGAEYGNGEIPTWESQYYEPFGPENGGVRGDGTPPEVKNILYAKNRIYDDVAVASTSTIKKLVRADDDILNDYSETAVVDPNGGYTYDITVSSGAEPIKDIVIYDRLEYAVADRAAEDDMDFEGKQTLDEVWQGEFAGLDTTELEEERIGVKVYYSERQDAPRPEKNDGGTYSTPDEVFKDPDSGWVLSTDWPEKKPLSEVKAIAVDLRKNKWGGSYTLSDMESIGFKIQMKAPKTADEQKPYTYNNSSYYFRPQRSATAEMAVGNSVRVELEQEKKDLELIKKLANPEDVPESLRNQEFCFTITYPALGEEGTDKEYPPFAYQAYTLYREKDGAWTEVDDQVRTTDKEGKLTLYDGEKAVFKNVRGCANLIVTEEESPFWKPRWTDSKDTEPSSAKRVVEFTNTYRPVLYIQKKTQAVPEEKKEEVKEKHTFAFEVNASYINKEGKEIHQTFDENTVCWLVDAARTDGGAPNKLGERNFNEEGVLELKDGEIAAVFLDSPNSSYIVKERLDEGSNPEDWLCKNPKQEGAASVKGSKVEITNIYRWKELTLLKEITHQDDADVEAARKDLPFTFEVREVIQNEAGEEIEKTVTGKEWCLLNKDGSEPEEGQLPDGITKEDEIFPTSGTLDDRGRFTCAMADRKVKIKDLEAGKTYVLYEVDYNAEGEEYPDKITDAQKKLLELYKPVNGGILEVTMPIYSIGKAGTVTNDYQMRPLTVSKQVLLGENPTKEQIEAAKTREFTMVATVNGELFANKTYMILKNGQQEEKGSTDEKGQLSLKDGERVYFKDAGLLGDTFEVKEIPDTETNGIRFDQVYPPEHKPYQGTFAGEGGTVNFINGSGDSLVLMKEYIGGDDKGKEIASEISKDAKRREEFAVKAELVLYDAQGREIRADKMQGYNEGSPVTVIDQESGELSQFIWPARERTLILEPGKMYILPKSILVEWNPYPDGGGSGSVNIQEIASYRITETKTDYGHLYQEETEDGKTTETWLHIQKKPQGAVSGTVKENPLVKLVNEITVPKWDKGSFIEKRMAIDTENHLPQEVMEGAVLTLRLERYQEKTKTWLPAGGVPYLKSERLIYDGNTYDVSADYQVTEGTYGVTAEDGNIVCVKSEETFSYPVVYFTQDKVYLNLYGDTLPDGGALVEGTLRLVEVPELCDPAWGYLTGYGKAGNLSYAMDTRDGSIFYNRTGGSPVVIEKVMETDSDETFTMNLRQVLSQSQDPIRRPEDILKSQAVPGIPYIVYDRTTNQEINRSQTGRNGEIYLKAGQYARLELAEETKWTVEEQRSATTVLEDLEGTPDNTNRLSSNLMLINQPGETVQVGTITYDANGGVFGTEEDGPAVRRISYYMENGEPKPMGEEIERPINGYNVFGGWYKDKDCKEAFNLRDYDCGADLKVYAKWKVKKPADVKYAVMLYGIEADNYEGGGSDKAGLTFGPATEKNYKRDFKAHLRDGELGNCIHWDSWEEIIANSQKDPHIYDQCLSNGCTKAVELCLSDELKGENVSFMSGDGVSILETSIKAKYRKWNDKPRNTGGWPASRMRATLNGSDRWTQDEVAGKDLLNSWNCMLSAFPQELQDAIVAKEVRSDTVYNDYEESIQNGTNVITYDKLWLFSVKEYYAEGVANGGYETKESPVRENEGIRYQKAHKNQYLAAGFSEEYDSRNGHILRSISNNKYYGWGKDDIFRVLNAGYIVDNPPDWDYYGISPGFCIR